MPRSTERGQCPYCGSPSGFKRNLDTGSQFCFACHHITPGNYAADLAKQAFHDRDLQQTIEQVDDADLDANFSAPTVGYLARSGLTVPYALDLGFQTHIATGRLYLPVSDHLGADFGYLLRSETLQPKVLSYNAPYGCPKAVTPDRLLVITEDYLSAIAVTRVGFTALALLTTQPSQEALRIAQAARNVIIWLDPDHAGESGAIKTMQTLANVAQIIRKDEPKSIPLKQVSNILRFLR